MMRAFIMLGQGGIVTSWGMYSLARQIRTIPQVTCNIQSWKAVATVVEAIRNQPAEIKTVLIGYSLGANSVTQVAADVRRPIALLVAYDPSVLQTDGIMPIGTNVAKSICYTSDNYVMPWGHGKLQGHNVTNEITHDAHLYVCYDQTLHDRTIAAVRAALG